MKPSRRPQECTEGKGAPRAATNFVFFFCSFMSLNKSLQSSCTFFSFFFLHTHTHVSFASTPSTCVVLKTMIFYFTGRTAEFTTKYGTECNDRAFLLGPFFFFFFISFSLLGFPKKKKMPSFFLLLLLFFSFYLGRYL